MISASSRRWTTQWQAASLSKGGLLQPADCPRTIKESGEAERISQNHLGQDR